jgi:hypothetical protein
VRDAQVGEFPSTRYPRINPRHVYIWVRVGGRWRRGYIQAWVHDRSADRWLVWGSYDDDKVRKVWEWFVYDEETIRPRHGDEAPPTA